MSNEANPEGFTAVKNWIIRDTTLSAQALLVLMVLESRAGKYGASWPSQSLMAREARMSERSVRNALMELRDAGLVSWKAKYAANGARTSNVYWVSYDRPNPAIMRQPDGDDPPGTTYRPPQNHVPDPMAPPADEEEPPKKTQMKKPPQPPASGGSVHDDPAPLFDVEEPPPASPPPRRRDRGVPAQIPGWEDFWAVYPRKVGKEAARRAYGRAVKKVGPEVVLAGVRRMAADPNLPEKQFIPNPGTWLNQGRWDDEPYPPRAGAVEKPRPNRVQQNMAFVDELRAKHGGMSGERGTMGVTPEIPGIEGSPR